MQETYRAQRTREAEVRRRPGYRISLAIPLLIILSTLAYNAAAHLDNKRISDAIVVLGTPEPCFVDRVRHGADLFKQGWAGRMIALTPQTADMAREGGVPPEVILVGSKQAHTDGEAIETKRIMTENRMETVIVVTEPYQNIRGLDIFRAYGLDATISPTADTACTGGRLGAINAIRDVGALAFFQILKVTGGRYPTGAWTQQNYY